MKTMLLFIIFCGIVGSVVHAISIDELPREKYQELGDLNLGVVVPVHEFAQEGFCSRKVRELGVLQRIEAVAQVFYVTFLLLIMQKS